MRSLLVVGSCIAGCVVAPKPLPGVTEPMTHMVRIITDDNISLSAQVHGQGRDTLVVLHGGPGLHSGYLIPDLQPLGRRATLIFYDQRGGGQSQLPDEFGDVTAQRHISDLETVRRHFRLDKMTLLGHSWGGLLAGLYTARHPERVKGLVLVGADPPSYAPTWPTIDVFRGLDSADLARLGALSDWAERGDGGDACREFWTLVLRPRFATADGMTRMRGDMCSVPMQSWRNLGRAQRTRVAMGEWDIRPALSRIAVPTLIIHGDSDVTPVLTAEQWRSALPRSRLVVFEGTGHFPHVEQSERFVRLVAEFLADVF